jgi:RNA polymerase sigma-B factor
MSATAVPLHDHHRENELWRRLNHQRDQVAREELVRIYMPIARRMAGRYAGIVEPYDDLVQVASIGLLNAIDRFDPAKGTPFLAFAKPTIYGELKRYFRDKVWTIRVPRALHDRIAAIEAATEELTEELSRGPSVAELSGRLKLEPEEVLEALEARENRRPLGLEAPVRGTQGEEDSAPEWIGGTDDGYELIEDRLTLEAVLPTLAEREGEVLRLRFIEELPQSQIAARIGCSQMHVSRLLRATLERLRAAAAEGPEPGVDADRVAGDGFR